MRNPRLAALLVQAVIENRQEQADKATDIMLADIQNEKIILIDDIIRVKKHLFCLGEYQHSEHMNINAAGQLFDTLYDMDKISLQILYKEYCVQVDQIGKQKINQLKY